MKISLVTISFNQAAYLEQALLSVREQSYPDLEYIVVDPGSTDGSRDIIERHRDCISHVVFEPDAGPADGLNRGFARATGEIFGYLNSDDLLLPGALRRVAANFLLSPQADLVYGHGYVIDREGRIMRHCLSDRYSLRRSAYGHSVIMQQATFWRRQAFIEVGGFNASNRLSWDGEFWMDLTLAGKRFHRTDEYWACFREHEESITYNFHGRSGDTPFGREQRRLFQKAMGRSPQARDTLFSVWARLEKWLVDPKNFGVRLSELMTKPKLFHIPGTSDRSS